MSAGEGTVEFGVIKEFQDQVPLPSRNGRPTTEIGAMTQWAPGVPGWAQYIGDDLERSPALQWPQSVLTYSQMRNDAQVQGLYHGTTLPLRRYHWLIDPNGCDPAKVKILSADLNLPIKGQEAQPRLRAQGRFSFKKHLQDALLALVFGHYPFEQVGTIGKDRLWHLTKLAPRPPETISVINLTMSGALDSFVQFYSNMGGGSPIPIPVESTVWYAWQMEGANWPGRSMLRACYRNWLRKDRLLRVDAMKNDRNGMGVPIAEAPPNLSSPATMRLDRLMRNLRAGDNSGGAVPNGTKVTFQGVNGTLPDTLASMKFDNEEMARAWLAMFMQLGQTETGSRALGSEFIDFFADAVDEIGLWFCDTFNEHVIEDYWDWNYGEDEDTTPQLVFQRNPDSAFVGRDFANLVRWGAITVDIELENSIRERYGLPQRDENDPPPNGPPPTVIPPGSTTVPPTPGTPVEPTTEPSPGDTPASARRGRPARATVSSPVSLPARPLRRALYSHEIEASVDWAHMDTNWQQARDLLVRQVSAAQMRQIDQLHDMIVEAGNDLDELCDVQASPTMEPLILDAMSAIAIQGARDAQAEALRQGHSVDLPDLAALSTSQATRAQTMDKFLADSISAAARSNAMRLAGGKLTGHEIADMTKTKLSNFSDAYLRDNLGGSLTAAMNSGRRATMGLGNPANIYASEILDDHTCEECIAEDGTQFVTLDDAERDYPSGGFVDCLGGGRCRGTLVAVYSDETQATLE